MKCKVIGIYSTKGGVGKTTSAVNLAYLAAKNGYNTLIWDLDTQASATFYARIRAKVKGGAKKLINRKTDAQKVIKDTIYNNLSILPADTSVRHLDLLVNDQKKSQNALKKIVKEVKDEYDLVFLDSPPGMSILSEAIFHTSDILLVPTIPSTLSIRTLELLDEHFASLELTQEQIIPFFSLVDLRKKMHREILEIYAQDPRFLQNFIPNASIVEQMGMRQSPLLAFNRASKASRSYITIWDEIKSRGGIKVKS